MKVSQQFSLRSECAIKGASPAAHTNYSKWTLGGDRT